MQLELCKMNLATIKIAIPHFQIQLGINNLNKEINEQEELI